MKEYIFNKEDIKTAIVKKSNFNFESITELNKISCGGFGCVYKVKFENFDKYLCIKIQRSQNFIKKFKKLFEEKNLNNLLVDFIPKIYEIGNLKIRNYNLSYIIMEYFPYPSLEKIKIDNQNVCRLFIFLLQFMNILHTNNLSYPDIKPENIILVDSKFKIIDVETIIPLITLPKNNSYIISTQRFDISNKNYYSSHQLNQLISCIYTCLDIMNMYPKCPNQNIYSYANYLINFAKDNDIYNPRIIENNTTFNNLFTKLNIITHNVLYTILSLFYMYILLIPQYTISYINISFWFTIFTFYSQYINNTENTIQLCNNTDVKQHLKIITGYCPQSYDDSVNIENEILKIPSIINKDIYIEILHEYVKLQQQSYDKLPLFIKQTPRYQKINPYNTEDKYFIFKQDPRALFINTLYNYI